MNEDGTITGTPEESGEFTVTLAAWAEGCTTKTVELTLTIASDEGDTPVTPPDDGDDEGDTPVTPPDDGGDEEEPGGGCACGVEAGFVATMAIALAGIAVGIVVLKKKNNGK